MARLANVPYVLRPLGTLNGYGLEQRRRALKRFSLTLIEGPIVRHAACVHFTSEAERAEANRLGWAFKSAVIPLGVDPEEHGRVSSGLTARLPSGRLRI